MECPQCGQPVRLVAGHEAAALNQPEGPAVPRWTCDNDACGWSSS